MKGNVTKNSGKKRPAKKKFDKDSKGAVNNTKDDASKVRPSGHNAASWYANDPDLLRDAGSFSFNNPLGNSTRVSELTKFDSTVTYSNLSNLDLPIPGLAVIEYVPTYGGSQEGLPGAFNSSNPINVVANALYTTIRKPNSGAWNYEPADLMKYMIAMDSIFSYYSWMTRVYGACRIYSTVNRYWPKAIIYGCHVDFDDVLRNLADLRYYINSFALRANQLSVPDFMPIFARHMLMNAGVYKDKPSDKAQMYMFNPRFLYKYNETETPARLDPVNINSAVGTGAGNLLSVRDLMALGDDLLTAVLNSEDIGIIGGDILKRFESNLTKLAGITEDWVAVPDYIDEIAFQIQNLRLVGDIVVSAPDKLGYIYEGTTIGLDAGMLYQQLVSVGDNSSKLINLAHPLNLPMDMHSIRPEDVIEATRLLVFGKVTWSSDLINFSNLVTVCGSEVCTKMYIISLNASSGAPGIIGTYTSNSISTIASSQMLSMFEGHPIMYHVNLDKTTGSISFNAALPNYDYDNYSVVGENDLRKLHETALLSLFGIPSKGVM